MKLTIGYLLIVLGTASLVIPHWIRIEFCFIAVGAAMVTDYLKKKG